MRIDERRFSSALIAAGLVLLIGSSAMAETITLRSGNGPVGTPDTFITDINTGSCCVEFPPFTAADFAAAASGPPAWVIGQVVGVWAPSLPCDQAAQWIGVAQGGPPATALYAYHFNVTSECIDVATLNFCWTADDQLGGNTANLPGVYLNGIGVPISGGNYATQTSAGPVPVGALLQPGPNVLYVYNPDIGAAVSGVMFSAVLNITPCIVPTESSTWSGIKARHE